MSTQSSIVEKIRTLANAQGHSLPTLEMKLNLGNGTISRWSKSAPNSDKLMKVAEYFHVSIDYLLGRDPGTIHQPINFSEEGIFYVPFDDDDLEALGNALKGYSPVNLNEEEREMIHKFRQLDARGQSAVYNVVDHEYTTLTGETSDTSPQQT